MKTTYYPYQPILIVDDEAEAIHSIELTLRVHQIDNLLSLQDSREVIPLIQEREIGLVLLDLRMPHLSGTELLPTVTREFPEIPVIVITAANEVSAAVESMKAGAFDYLVKPIEPEQFIPAVKRAIRFKEMQWESSIIKRSLQSKTLSSPTAFETIITQNERMWVSFHYVEAIASTPYPVLITGETGTGKGLLARVIHKLSGREGEFTTVNTAGVDDTFFSDTLFGHIKGAYTGAEQHRAGLIEVAKAGTLFLDEIGDLSFISQVKLLRLLEEREYYPIGSDLPKRTDSRFILATSRNLDEMTEAGKFRKELYFRLHTHHVHLLPLRERLDDIPLLLEYFISQASRDLQKKKPTVPKELLTMLSLYDFPGNVRELQAMVFDAVSRNDSETLFTDSFREAMTSRSAAGSSKTPRLFQPGKLPSLREAEEYLINRAMQAAGNNQRIAAEMLGISRQALNQKLKKVKDSNA